MNRFLVYIIFLLVTHFLFGQQNLVPNGSFEEYTECPTSNELNNGQFEKAVGWFRPTNSTPDFYHDCNNSINGTVGVPSNYWGYQDPYQGQGYVGFGAICWDSNGIDTGNEYIRAKLNSPLTPCFQYRFRMYVSLADESTHGVGKIGVLFTNENDFTQTWVELDENPQIIHNNSPIVDSANWIKVEGTFIAKGFENYITLGYFRNTVISDTSFVQDSNYGSCAYYYVDSISLYEVGIVSEEICDVGDLSFPNIITPNNDNTNDYIDATPYFAITNEIVILNRWGNLINILNKEQPIWDGTTTSGKECTEGAYFYKFEYQWGDELKNKSGFIHLVR